MMFRFITALKKKKPESYSPPALIYQHNTLQIPAKSKLDFGKFKKFSKKILNRTSKILAKNSLDKVGAGPQWHLNCEDLEIVQYREEDSRKFENFQDLPVEIRLAILEYYLEEARITTIQFCSDPLFQYHYIIGRTFRLGCGSLPPILCINHEYRETFLERFTIMGLPRSMTTLSLEDALIQADNEHPNIGFDGLTPDSFDSVFPVYDTYTRRNIIYQPKDTIWIQGDFWLDEVRRSTLARSVFHDLQHLAVQYNTRNQDLFNEDEMWDLVECMLSTFPDLKTIAFVLEAEDVIAERPIYNGEINFNIPESINITTALPADSHPPPGLLLRLRNMMPKKQLPPPPETRTIIASYPPDELVGIMRGMLEDIKDRAIRHGYEFLGNGWDTPREASTWVIPEVIVVTANLSTSSGTRISKPAIINV
ncbi:hypothetical protein EYC80_003103 [Monilinia laxa]|uniref:2EXR domain-containing protein n=1 Tax=Monilinia laxa TaxID=61186 RepID=A0A5N6KCW9_MONLA|nr:hypothetical protein EYC80_003103 [Monilinia laxa]